MELYDYKMLYDYNDCEKFLKMNSNKLSDLKVRLIVIENENSLKTYDYIIKDVWFMLDTFIMYKTSCECREGLNQKFFPLTTFTRSNLETLNIILVKISELIKNNKISNNDPISSKYNDIFKRLGIGRNLRNKLEHEKDPYYDGRLGEIEKNFNLIKQIEFVENVIELFELLKGHNLKIKPKNLIISYNSLSVLQRKVVTTETAQLSTSIFRYISELSFIISDRAKSSQPTADIEKIIIDQGLKLIELNKSINFLYNRTMFNELQSKMHTTPDEYFCKLSLIKAYQICDKLGYYIAYKRCYNLTKTYFKDVVDRIIKDNTRPYQKVENKIVQFRNDNEYEELSSIRNFCEHKNGIIDYAIEMDKIVTLIIILHNKLTKIIYDILESYFEDNGIALGERSFKETIAKSKYIDI